MKQTLKDLKKAVELRLRRHSNITAVAMQRASSCVAHLQWCGYVVKTVTVQRERVTVEIDPPGPRMTGTKHLSRFHAKHRETVTVTTRLGCQVRWVEREPIRPAKVGDVRFFNAADFNDAVSVGTPVRYFPSEDDASYVDTKTRSKAWELGSGHVVVAVEGRAGGVSIQHLQMRVEG